MQIRSRVTSKGEKRYTVRYKDPASGQWTEHVAGSTLKSAQALKNRYELEIAQGTFGLEPEEPEGFSSFSDSFLKAREGRIKDSTLNDYRQVIENHLKPYFGDMTLPDITPAVVQEFVNGLQDNGLTSSTGAKIYRYLKAVLRHAISLGLIHRDPTVAIRPPKSEAKQARFLDPKEARALIAAAPDDMKPVIITLLYTGLRVGEALALTWDDIDLKGATLEVRRNWYKGKITTPKTPTSARTIPLVRQVRDVLKGEKGKPADFVFFPAVNGDRYNAIRKGFERAREAAKMEDLRIHDLRHSFASLCVLAQVDIRTLKEMMGHSSITVTLDIYGGLYRTSLKRAASNLEKVI